MIYGELIELGLETLFQATNLPILFLLELLLNLWIYPSTTTINDDPDELIEV